MSFRNLGQEFRTLGQEGDIRHTYDDCRRWHRKDRKLLNRFVELFEPRPVEDKSGIQDPGHVQSGVT